MLIAAPFRYKEKNYGGFQWKFNKDTPDLTDFGCNDKASSIRVGPGTTVTLFDNSKYGGGSIVFNTDAGDLGKLNDRANSVKIATR